jgi:cysteinyl-tRNA synthetase
VTERSAAAIRQFEEALDDDLNTAEALAAVFEYVRAINSALDEHQFQEENRWDAARVLEVFDGLFDVLKPSAPAGAAETAIPSNGEIDSYIEERQQAKKSRDFARADQIRALLDGKGILLEDTREGVRWKRK